MGRALREPRNSAKFGAGGCLEAAFLPLATRAGAPCLDPSSAPHLSLKLVKAEDPSENSVPSIDAIHRA